MQAPPQHPTPDGSDLPADVLHSLLAHESEAPAQPQDAALIARAKAKLKSGMHQALPQSITSALEDGRWRQMIPGIERKTLLRQGDDVSVLLRMAVGSVLPAHAHAADEHCIVLSGCLRLGNSEVRVRSGGFHWVAQHSAHEPIVAEEESLVYLRGALDVH